MDLKYEGIEELHQKISSRKIQLEAESFVTKQIPQQQNQNQNKQQKHNNNGKQTINLENALNTTSNTNTNTNTNMNANSTNTNDNNGWISTKKDKRTTNNNANNSNNNKSNYSSLPGTNNNGNSTTKTKTNSNTTTTVNPSSLFPPTKKQKITTDLLLDDDSDNSTTTSMHLNNHINTNTNIHTNNHTITNTNNSMVRSTSTGTTKGTILAAFDNFNSNNNNINNNQNFEKSKQQQQQIQTPNKSPTIPLQQNLNSASSSLFDSNEKIPNNNINISNQNVSANQISPISTTKRKSNSTGSEGVSTPKHKQQHHQPQQQSSSEQQFDHSERQNNFQNNNNQIQPTLRIEISPMKTPQVSPRKPISPRKSLTPGSTMPPTGMPALEPLTENQNEEQIIQTEFTNQNEIINVNNNNLNKNNTNNRNNDENRVRIGAGLNFENQMEIEQHQNEQNQNEQQQHQPRFQIPDTPSTPNKIHDETSSQQQNGEADSRQNQIIQNNNENANNLDRFSELEEKFTKLQNQILQQSNQSHNQTISNNWKIFTGIQVRILNSGEIGYVSKIISSNQVIVKLASSHFNHLTDIEKLIPVEINEKHLKGHARIISMNSDLCGCVVFIEEIDFLKRIALVSLSKNLPNLSFSLSELAPFEIFLN